LKKGGQEYVVFGGRILLFVTGEIKRDHCVCRSSSNTK
jgi:hypothetical protein